MTHTSIVVFSIIFQLLAAWLALRLIRLTKHRAAWICVAVALVLMITRRIFPLTPAYASQEPSFWHLYEFIGLAISALILAGMFYMHRYLDDTLAAERCLQESAQRYRTLAKNIPNSAVLLFDRNHYFTLAEGPLLEQLGILQEHFEGKNIWQISLPDGLAERILPLQESALQGTSTRIEQPYKERVYSAQFIPITVEGREVTGGMVMVSDITEQREAENERTAAYEFLQNTIDGVAEPVMVIGLDYQVKLMNRVVRDSYAGGLTPARQQCYFLSHHHDAPCHDLSHPCPLQLVRETLLPVTVLHEHHNTFGEVRLVEIMASPLLDAQGQLQGIIEASRDITERKKAEDALCESESILRSFLEESQDAILLTDEQGGLIQWSKGAEILTGYTRAESLGRPIWDAQFRSLPDELKTAWYYERIKSALQASLQGGQGPLLNKFVEAVIQRLDGTCQVVQSLAFTIRTDKGFLFGCILRDITERKQAEAELLRLRKAVEASGEVIFLTDREGLITFINPEFTRLYGYAADEVVGKVTPRILKSGDMNPEGYRLFWQTILGKQVAKGEMVNRTKDGRLLTIESSVNPVLDESGEIGGFLAIQRDISERKEAEQERSRLLSAVESSIDGIAITDENDQFIYDNQAHARIHGFSEGELVGQTWRVLVPKAAEQAIDSAFQHELHNKEIGYVVTEAMGVRKDGSQVPIEFRAKALWGKDGRYSGHICNVVDISERKQVEEVRRRRTEELEILARVSAAMRTARTRIEISQVLLQQLSILLDLQGAALTLLDANTREILVALGYGDWESWTGTRLSAEKEDATSPLAFMQPYQNNNAGDDPNFLNARLPNSQPCVTGVPLIANEARIGAIWVGRKSAFLQEDMQLLEAIRDLAANAIQRQTLNENLQTQLEVLRSTQARLVQNEKLAAVGQLVSGVAHELNNPLTSVMLYSQMAQQSDLDEPTRRNLSKAVSEARRAGVIVRGLLDFARQRTPKREIIQVNEILRLSLDLVSYELRAHNIELELQLSEKLPKLSADPHQLQQVFVNLIQNAWHAMNLANGHGHLQIRTEFGESKYGAPPGQGREVVRICFSDDGPGISYENMSKIFDPFFTTMPDGSGTGLGLSICHGIITEHDGHIWAESPLGQSTAFIIELPTAPIPETIALDPVKSTAVSDVLAEKYRILVLDDEPNIAAVLLQALRGAGYGADSAGNGFEGLQRLKEASYDLILCDIRMPEFNGLDFYREVERNDRQLLNKIIFITGDTVSPATRRFIEEKRVRYLAKPFELSELLDAVRTTMDQSRSFQHG